jgi:hypothetical protein
MKAIKIYDQEDNRTIGIFEEQDGKFTALTYIQSKTFKTLKAAEKWIQKYI